MRRTLIGLAALAVAMSSCTNNELLEGVQSPDNAIDYAPYVGRATRAESMTLDKLNNFRVVAYGTSGAYADAAAFTGNGYNEVVSLSGGTWSGTETRYWPDEPELMSFFAYSPQDAGAFTAATAGGYPSLAFSVNADPASQVDLLGAAMIDQTKKSDNKNVAFNLKHLLTQVTFKAKAGSTAYTVKVKSIKMNKINPEATFTYDGSATVGAWGATSGTAADYTYVAHTDMADNTTDTPAGNETPEAVKGENLMLIPSAKGTLAGVEMEVVYQCYKAGTEPLEALGSEITKKVTLTDEDEWLMGKRVNYVMILHRQSGPIVFETEIEEWAAETTQDKEVNDIFNTTELDLADGTTSIQPIEITNRAGVDAAFTLKSGADWLKISTNADGSGAVKEYTYTPVTRAGLEAKTTLYVVAEYNGTATAREATITWERTGAEPVVLKVSQVAIAEDKPFGDNLTASITDDTYNQGVAFTYTENRGAAYNYTLTSSASWLTISEESGKPATAKQTYTYTANGTLEPSKTLYLYANDVTFKERTATVTLKRTGMKDMVLTVTQDMTVEPYIIYGQAPCSNISLFVGSTTTSYNGWSKDHTNYITPNASSGLAQKPFYRFLVSKVEYVSGSGTPTASENIWVLAYDRCKGMTPANKWRLPVASEQMLIDVNNNNLKTAFTEYEQATPTNDGYKITLTKTTATLYMGVNNYDISQRGFSNSPSFGFRCIREVP